MDLKSYRGPQKLKFHIQDLLARYYIREHKLQDTRVLLTSKYEVHLPYITKPPPLMTPKWSQFWKLIDISVWRNKTLGVDIAQGNNGVGRRWRKTAAGDARLEKRWALSWECRPEYQEFQMVGVHYLDNVSVPPTISHQTYLPFSLSGPPFPSERPNPPSTFWSVPSNETTLPRSASNNISNSLIRCSRTYSLRFMVSISSFLLARCFWADRRLISRRSKIILADKTQDWGMNIRSRRSRRFRSSSEAETALSVFDRRLREDTESPVELGMGELAYNCWGETAVFRAVIACSVGQDLCPSTSCRLSMSIPPTPKSPTFEWLIMPERASSSVSTSVLLYSSEWSIDDGVECQEAAVDGRYESTEGCCRWTARS